MPALSPQRLGRFCWRRREEIVFQKWGEADKGLEAWTGGVGRGRTRRAAGHTMDGPGWPLGAWLSP